MRRTTRSTAALTGGLSAALLAAVLVPPHAAARAPGCELRRMPLPQASSWGTVMDIELVDGRPVYYGSYEATDADGSRHQRAVVWRGLGAAPQLVGPGLEHDTAFDLTASGLVNGVSEDASGDLRPWVRDLRTGALHWVSTASGPDAGWVVPRRLNESGALSGTGSRGRGEARADDALAWDHYTGEPRALPAPGRGAMAFGLDDRGHRAGFVAHQHLAGDGRWTIFRPTVWYADGTVRTAASAGLDAVPRALTESGQMSGGTWWGDDPAAGHSEAAFWPSVDRIVGLGLLPGGGWSEAFGMDDAGSVVGVGDRAVDGSHPMASPWGTVEHGFLWQGQRDAVHVLPSLHGIATRSRDWRTWYSTHAAHAVHTGLDQVGAGTHAGFTDHGTPVGAPTVYLNASRCGVEVATSHEPFAEQDLADVQATSAARGRR